ncbi:helix-turn-helix domain-containing protein [Halosquirtibacter xylanolyticus]|uniref:helix-turn-helix domain-containing protein n=1 Tax=Halosquirtibacter xylanolyticus TaxID=3374599 RepID=UPI00374947E0|nr:helix-turn-helix domain-containing protein [Prolixibacteraceae bacterium]
MKKDSHTHDTPKAPFVRHTLLCLKTEKATLQKVQNELNRLVDIICLLKDLLHPLLMRKDRWLDTQDVLVLLHISNRKLVSLRNRGTLPYTRLGKKYLYKESDVMAMLHKNYRSQNTSPPNEDKEK